jgi:hypothetical protein
MARGGGPWPDPATKAPTDQAQLAEWRHSYQLPGFNRLFPDADHDGTLSDCDLCGQPPSAH